MTQDARRIHMADANGAPICGFAPATCPASLMREDVTCKICARYIATHVSIKKIAWDGWEAWGTGMPLIRHRSSSPIRAVDAVSKQIRGFGGSR